MNDSLGAKAAGLLLGGAMLVAFVPAGMAAEQSARISRALQEVKIETPGGGARAVRAGGAVPAGSTVRTGKAARAELVLPGPAVLRLGGGTSLGLKEPAFVLGDGLVLFQAGRQARRTKLESGAIKLDFRGSTGLIERHGAAYVKVLVLEGDARVYTSKLGESIVLKPGQLLITTPKAKSLPEPVHFAIEQLHKTSLLMNADFAPLASRASIASEIKKQKSDPRYIPTNLMIFGRGTLVNLLPPTAAPQASPSPSTRPSRSP